MAGGSRRKAPDRSLQSGAYFSAHRDYGVLPRSPAEALEPDYAPQPPTGGNEWHRRPFVKLLNTAMTAAFVAVVGLALLFYYVRVQFDQPGPLDYATVVAIPKGEGVRQIASRLEREGVIADQRIFLGIVMYFGAHDRLKAGEYAITKHASMRNVLDTLVEGKAILYSVSIPEGLTSYQIVQKLKSHPELTGDLDLVPPEGTLMPDTYRIARGTDRNDLVARMQSEQRRFMEKLWPQRVSNLPFETPQEAVILASIVEKETGKVDERPRVASVFINRLRKSMRLQSDPTIIYGLSGGKGTLGRGILKSEIEQMTPYNTYTMKGLPPTPIANPGRAALEAVLRPAKSSDLYFVADGSGGHSFAESYDDHKNNVTVWRQIEKEIREKQQKAKEEAEKLAAAEAAKAAGVDQKTAAADPKAVVADPKAANGKAAALSDPKVVNGKTVVPPDSKATIPTGGTGIAVISAPPPVAEDPEADTGAIPPVPLRKPKV
jgi:UPF0755 protein